MLLQKKLLFLWCFTINTCAFAQTIGVKAGGNWTSLVSNTPLGQLIGFEHRFSFHAGVLMDFRVSDRLIFQPNLL